jgi:hypothetical protein
MLLNADRASNPLGNIFEKRDYIGLVLEKTGHIKLSLWSIPEPFARIVSLVLILCCTFAFFHVANMSS